MLNKNLSLEWNNLNFFINEKNSQKHILNNISGQITSHNLLGILGSSGSGKTSLLNILANKVKKNNDISLTGRITLNNKPRSTINFKKLSAYVQQDDLLFPQMTVYQTFLMTAQLRLPKNISAGTGHDKLINDLINRLGLHHIKNSKIGNIQNRGISGGEKKRTCIGIELLTKPSIIFLDEPTSGLDSYQAKNVIKILKELSNLGHIVICSIHQPSSSIYELFDKIMFLSNGNSIYFGNGGIECVNYFKNLGYECPQHYNPADYILDLISIDNSSEESKNISEERLQLFIENNKNQMENRGFADIDNDYNDINNNIKFHSTWTKQFKLLLTRSFIEEIKNTTGLAIRFVTNFFFTVIISMLFSGLDNSQKSIQNTFGVLFFLCINQAFSCLFPTLKKFSIEKEIVNKERESKSYHTSAFYLSKLLSTLPFDLIVVYIYISTVYFIIGLNPNIGAFLIFILIISLLIFSSVGLGMFISSIASDSEMAISIASPFMIVLLLFGGFYANISNIPVWISWIQYISFINWGFQALSINEYKGKTLECLDTNDCLTTGEEVLERFSFTEFSKEECITYLLLVGISFHILAYLVLRFKRPKYQKVVDLI